MPDKKKRKYAVVRILDDQEYRQFLESLKGLTVSYWFRQKMREQIQEGA